MNEDAYELSCVECRTALVSLGYKSSLLSNGKINVYSTNIYSIKIREVYDYFATKNCCCTIIDVACTSCGNIIGYHVVQPCRQCLNSDTNGNMWIFCETRVVGTLLHNLTGNEDFLAKKLNYGRICIENDPER